MQTVLSGNAARISVDGADHDYKYSRYYPRPFYAENIFYTAVGGGDELVYLYIVEQVVKRGHKRISDKDDDTDIIDVMLDYVKSETAAGREIGYSTDGRVRILD